MGMGWIGWLVLLGLLSGWGEGEGKSVLFSSYFFCMFFNANLCMFCWYFRELCTV